MDGATRQHLHAWEDAVIAVINECASKLPKGAVAVTIERGVSGPHGFSTTIDITPRNPDAAWIGGGLDSPGEFNLTFGEIWLEYFGRDDEEQTLSDLRELLEATFAGRLYQKGSGATASGYAIFSGGRRYSFGALNGWFRKLFEMARPYASYE